MKTVLFCAVLVCFVAAVNSTVCSTDGDFAGQLESLHTRLEKFFTDEVKGYAWSGPGCCKKEAMPYISKGRCAALCLAQVGGKPQGNPEHKPCSRFTWWEHNGIEYCRIHNGCLNANNKPTENIVNKGYKGLTRVSDSTQPMLDLKFYAIHRNCMTQNKVGDDCKELLTNNNGNTGSVPGAGTGDAADTCNPRTVL